MDSRQYTILAEKFDFSGAQTENVIRKKEIYEIIHGDAVGFVIHVFGFSPHEPTAARSSGYETHEPPIMSKRESIARCNLIIKRLRKRTATFAEIEDYLNVESMIQGYNFQISKRTFQRVKDDIRALYNIDILFDFSKKVYYIEVDDQPEANQWIMEAFDTFHALNISDRLSQYIHFEQRKPRGTEHLYGVLHAIKNTFQIQFAYWKYWKDELTDRLVEPYALKEFRNRWYVLARDLGDQKIKSFALDRVRDLEILNSRFLFPEDFDVREHYRYCFGIISPNDQAPTDIILSFNTFQGQYIKSLPLHDSQKILIDDKNELRVQLELFMTQDFFMELLSFGNNLKVIHPPVLIERMKDAAKSMSAMYDEE